MPSDWAKLPVYVVGPAYDVAEFLSQVGGRRRASRRGGPGGSVRVLIRVSEAPGFTPPAAKPRPQPPLTQLTCSAPAGSRLILGPARLRHTPVPRGRAAGDRTAGPEAGPVPAAPGDRPCRRGVCPARREAGRGPVPLRTVGSKAVLRWVPPGSGFRAAEKSPQPADQRAVNRPPGPRSRPTSPNQISSRVPVRGVFGRWLMSEVRPFSVSRRARATKTLPPT